MHTFGISLVYGTPTLGILHSQKRSLYFNFVPTILPFNTKKCETGKCLIQCDLMITRYFKQAVESKLEVLDSSRAGAWMHVVAPTETELTSLVAEYGLEDTIIEDIGDFFEVPRFEQEGSVSYFFTRYPCDVPDLDIDTAPLLIVLGETFILTIAKQEVPFLKSFIEGKRFFQTVQKATFFLDLLTALMSAYDRKLTRIRKMVYRDMGRVRSMRGKDLQRLVFIEQELNEMLSSLVPTNAWIHQLNKGNYIQMFSDDRELLEDLLIDGGQLIDSTKSILKTIQNIRTASEAIITQGLNITLRTLTATTIVLTIPTIIASLFGMNVPLPLEGKPYAFVIVLGLIFVGVGTTIYFFNRNRWI
jgi:magnesium transporter